jgi:hypothetical protein
VPTPHRFAAVDTDVLLALEAGDEECQEAIDGLKKIGFYCIVTETPLQELADICQQGNGEDVQIRAKQTLVAITNFGFLSPQLASVQMGVAERVAHTLIERCLPGGQLNDGLVVAEAAYQDCRLFITRSPMLLVEARDSLRIALVDHDLSAVVVTSPAELVEYFKASES